MKIAHINKDYDIYLRDESRYIGKADSISFPESISDIKKVLKSNSNTITLQGGRTGITGGAVPISGHIMNLSKMNKVKGMRKDRDTGEYYILVQPGIILSELDELLKTKDFSTDEWSVESLRSFEDFKQSGLWFFPPDPTETSASIGGMVSCNASGACSFLYGPVRNYVQKIKIVLYDGSVLNLERGKQKSKNGNLKLITDSGKVIKGQIPDYRMPEVKNASGYYIENDMDIIDLFTGSEGTLGIIAEVELKLIQYPEMIWGLAAFFESDEDAFRFVRSLKESTTTPAAVEFFNYTSLDLLRTQKKINPAFNEIPIIPEKYNNAVYVEFHQNNKDCVDSVMIEICELIIECNGDDEYTWLAMNSSEMKKMKFFRHAVPESVNCLIDKRKKNYPRLTKLSTDMAVPYNKLEEVYRMYNNSLKEENLQFVIFGHIGDNHLHVNILPENMNDYKKGKRLYTDWARKIANMGGTISAEHGIGKLKRSLLEEMYGEDGIKQMRRLKEIFDPGYRLNKGNLFNRQT